MEPKVILFPSIAAILNYDENIVIKSVLSAIPLPPVCSKVAECVQLEIRVALSRQPSAKVNWQMLTHASDRRPRACGSRPKHAEAALWMCGGPASY